MSRLRYKGSKQTITVGKERLQVTVPPVWVNSGTEAEELMTNKKPQLKVPGAKANIDQHMLELDQKWRKAEGRKQFNDLTDREKMLEGALPWNPEML